MAHLRDQLVLVMIAVATALALAGRAYFASAKSEASVGCPTGYVTESQGQKADAGVCMTAKHPESVLESIVRQAGLESVRSALYSHADPSAYSNAVSQHQALVKSGPKVDGTAGKWSPYGKGPLIVNDPAYTSVNGLGFRQQHGPDR